MSKAKDLCNSQKQEPMEPGARVITTYGLFIRVNDGKTLNPFVQYPINSSNFTFYSWKDLKMFGIVFK